MWRTTPELSPAGPPALLLVDGEAPTVTILDETTVRYEWSKPNPRFLPALAQARPPFIYRPAHYIKQFHADYADAETLAEMVEAAGAKSWAALHNRRDDMYRFDDPRLPTLQPWMNTTERNSQRYVLERNPFYHRFDSEGRQLPYIDTMEMTVAAGGLIPAKTNRGESDLQARGLSFSDAPVLKKGEGDGGYRTLLWESGYASEIALYPNLNYNDPVWREVMRDVRFRRALSLAISRETINKSLYFGLARTVNTAALPPSPFYSEEHAKAWTGFDPSAANALLDDMGLTEREGWVRKLPDGRPMEIIAETAGERQEELDALELVAEMWREIGDQAGVPPARPRHPAQQGLCGRVDDAGLVRLEPRHPDGGRGADRGRRRSISRCSAGRNGASISRPRASWARRRSTRRRRG
jgi:peptide/nickel transport system substrate-binding protein